MNIPTAAALLRLEDASMNAWPGLQTVLDGPWVVRFGEGCTRRANSISVFRPADDAPARLARCCALLAAKGLTPSVRLGQAMEAEMSPILDAAGFGAPFEETQTLWKPLSAATADPDVEIDDGGVPSRAWLDAKARLSGEAPAVDEARNRILAAIAVPVAFGAWRDEDGAIGAHAYVALHAGVASLNMVMTDPAQRGRGLAMKVCESLLAWAHGQGAHEACLQVRADNAPARRLYAHMGFSDPLYRYSYRTLEEAP